MARLSDVSKLHPAIRQSVKAIRKQLHEENIPFEVFEAFRTPSRQQYLYAQGRTRSGSKVTWAGPWSSIHQYGLAVDFVLKKNGKWSWDDTGNNAAAWTRMHEIAKENGMTPIYSRKTGKLIEKPHIQLAGISSKQLYLGKYPEGGDLAWAEQLGDLIESWKGSKAPPKPPTNLPNRPAFDPEDYEEDQSMSHTDLFKLIHPFVMKWEGEKYTDNPRDNGGPTKYGITQQTLTGWLGRKASKAEVKNLTRQTADKIFKANYFDRVKCEQMHPRIATVVYNGAVLHGVSRSGRFVQEALNVLKTIVNGEAVEIDGVIGKQTLSGIEKANPERLCQAYIEVQEGYLKRHEDFDYYGKGWLNRTHALREFISKLPAGSSSLGEQDMQLPENYKGIDTSSIIELLQALATNRIRRSNETRVSEPEEQLDEPANANGGNEALIALLTQLIEAQNKAPKPIPANQPINTPMGDAFGKTLGGLLNGKKTIIGIVGLVTTVLFPESQILSAILSPAVTETLKPLTPLLGTVFGGLSAWGGFHKLEKAIYRVAGRTAAQ
ncbi:MAG: glycosyl hydrolase 108 family protein [Lentilitoribacter sp.]